MHAETDFTNWVNLQFLCDIVRYLVVGVACNVSSHDGEQELFKLAARVTLDLRFEGFTVACFKLVFNFFKINLNSKRFYILRSQNTLMTFYWESIGQFLMIVSWV